MYTVDGMNQSAELGVVSDDIFVNGMEAAVSAVVPDGEHINVEVDGMNASADLSGHGTVSLGLNGMNARATVDDSIDLIERGSVEILSS
ncbi:hypothetical protein EXE46_07760 [Halorubrum sp. GN11_10-6_MGM]|uniref:hypothetical protein n=1 Tax=Halorubrum sp. GN11_10-6_MGM TaxID=2518112 RepID=UPI0010F4F634|nr:hypothetical protein [Halorubrum sp. GN11_10-6_MGM]TKX74752.1 hypothetical protein EXE46_07760 [Halorubrum sp. GN11_10-6_MGM]